VTAPSHGSSNAAEWKRNEEQITFAEAANVYPQLQLPLLQAFYAPSDLDLEHAAAIAAGLSKPTLGYGTFLHKAAEHEEPLHSRFFSALHRWVVLDPSLRGLELYHEHAISPAKLTPDIIGCLGRIERPSFIIECFRSASQSFEDKQLKSLRTYARGLFAVRAGGCSWHPWTDAFVDPMFCLLGVLLDISTGECHAFAYMAELPAGRLMEVPVLAEAPSESGWANLLALLRAWHQHRPRIAKGPVPVVKRTRVAVHAGRVFKLFRSQRVAVPAGRLPQPNVDWIPGARMELTSKEDEHPEVGAAERRQLVHCRHRLCHGRRSTAGITPRPLGKCSVRSAT
jgi:hypothetical protein